MSAAPPTADTGHARWERNLEGYRLIADALVTFRRIVARAMVKAGVEGSPSAAWPAEILARLEGRQREEEETERHPSAEGDLLAFATFADLAALTAADGAVAKLLARLTSAPKQLVELLEELEGLRHAISVARPLRDSDLDRLRELQSELRGMLAGSKGKDSRRASTGTGKTRARRGAPGAPKKTAAARAAPASSHPAGAATEAAFASRKARPPGAEPDRTGDSGTPRGSSAPEVAMAETLSEAALAAIASGEDRKLLTELHREVMTLAEGIYSGAPRLAAPLWKELVEQGWVDARRDELALDPLLKLHSLVEVLGGVEIDADRRRAVLAEAGFAPLLLELRQMFRRQLA